MEEKKRMVRRSADERIAELDKKIAYHHIFMVQGSMMKHPVISLAVAESLLRRQATGIMLEEVEVR